MNISTKYNNFPDIIIDNNTIIPKESRTCLGIMADRNLKLNYNIKRLFRLGNYNFVNIARVRKCLVTSSILLLIALVLFKFGYCSIIYYGLPVNHTRNIYQEIKICTRILYK